MTGPITPFAVHGQQTRRPVGMLIQSRDRALLQRPALVEIHHTLEFA